MTNLVGGRYEIVRELGRGGMGEVLLARQVNLGRLVVVKRVAPEHGDRYVRELLDEARLAARMHHPCIVSVLDVSAEGEPAFIVMEYVVGATLRELLQRAPDGNLPLEVALVIAIDVLRGLAYAHDTGDGIVHRDVKPRNIMVSSAGDAKLIDFGISRTLRDGAWESTSVSGTEGYMAPEQQAGGRVDGRADQYAVAITLREMLTGAAPDDDQVTAANRPRLEDATSVPKGRAALAPELDAILRRAAERDREARYPDCTAFATALEDFAREHDIDLMPVTVERWISKHLADRVATWEREVERASEPQLVSDLKRSSTEPASATVMSGEQVPTEQQRRRTRTIVLTAIGTTAVVGAVLAVRLVTRHAAAPQPLVVDLAARQLGGPDDAWLVPATEHVARRALRDLPERHFWLVPPGDGHATAHVELAVRLAPPGVVIEATRDGVALAHASAPSIFEAAAQLAPVLATALGGDRPDPGPDPEEAAELVRLGAHSYDEYRRFRILSEDARVPGWFDVELVIPGYEQLVREDPAWGHPYAELEWLYGRTTPKAKQLAADAHARVDPARGAGLALLDALVLESAGNAAKALTLVEPVFQHDNSDVLAGEILNSAYAIAERAEDAAAVTRTQLQRYPALFYAGDAANDLETSGRHADAERMIRAHIVEHPDNLTMARTLVKFELLRGDTEAARRAARHMLLIHGERPLVLAELYEAMIDANDFLEAQRIVDKMMLGSPLGTARAHYRGAVIAAFQGRLAAAFKLARQAAEELRPFGSESERPQALELVVALAPFVGERAVAVEALRARASELEANAKYARLQIRAAQSRFTAALLERDAVPSASRPACPTIADFIGPLDAKSREIARTGMVRDAARAGCVPCKEVVAAGFSATETSAASLVAFGQCARDEHELALARGAFERATQLWSSWSNPEASPVHAILAQYHLAGVLAELGDRPGAVQHYERFLAAWRDVDRPVPEVADAARQLAALQGR